MTPPAAVDHSPLRHRWRLLLPLIAILGIIAIAASLLFASRLFERDRQRQTMISDTLWAEQAVAFEGQRLTDALQTLGRQPAEVATEETFGRKSAAIVLRSPEVVHLYLWRGAAREVWRYPTADGAGERERPLGDDVVAAVAERALRLRRPAARDAGSPSNGLMLIAVPVEHAHADPAAIVAMVSLDRLLATIPWWFAHETQITLDDESGATLATRDPNVRGRGVYTHKIATQIADRTFYLNADSVHGAPSLVPNLLAASLCLLSALLAWTVYALWRDLSRRTRAEAALREQHAFRTAMENSLVTGLCARDMEGRITHANPAFAEMVGQPLQAILGTVPPLPFWAPARQGPVDTSYESVLVRRDGARLDVLVHEAPLLDGAGRQIGWMASMLDVSEQRRGAEFLRQQNERMQRMSRLMTMGEMASALAHELNQPLSAINSYIIAGLNTVEPAQGSRPDVDEASVYFRKAKLQTDRAGNVIRRVRQFVGASGPAIGPVLLDDVLAELLPLVRLQSGAAAEQVVLRLSPDAGAVMADRVLLEQVLLNLTKNAFEAMADLPAARRRVVIFSEVDAERPEQLVLGVRDGGPGLGERYEEVLARSFFTTKPGGLGMGLAVCRTALGLMGSLLHYAPAPGGGAIFRFALRRAAGANGVYAERRQTITTEGDIPP